MLPSLPHRAVLVGVCRAVITSTTTSITFANCTSVPQADGSSWRYCYTPQLLAWADAQYVCQQVGQLTQAIPMSLLTINSAAEFTNVTTWLPPASATFGYWTAGVKPGFGAGPYPAWAFNTTDTSYLAAATVTAPSSSVVPSWAYQDQGRVAYTGNCFNGQGCAIAIIPGTMPTMQYSDAGFVRVVMCKGYRPPVPPLPTSNSIPAGLYNLRPSAFLTLQSTSSVPRLVSTCPRHRS